MRQNGTTAAGRTILVAAIFLLPNELELSVS